MMGTPAQGQMTPLAHTRIGTNSDELVSMQTPSIGGYWDFTTVELCYQRQQRVVVASTDASSNFTGFYW